MIRRPPRSNRPDTLFPYTTRFRSPGLERGLGDPEQHRLAVGKLAALGSGLGVDLVHLLAVHLLADQQRGVPRFGDLDLLQHLANDHLDVLVVDLHALEPVDFLNLRHTSEERRVGKECVSTCRSRWSPYHYKK